MKKRLGQIAWFSQNNRLVAHSSVICIILSWIYWNNYIMIDAKSPVEICTHGITSTSEVTHIVTQEYIYFKMYTGLQKKLLSTLAQSLLFVDRSWNIWQFFEKLLYFLCAHTSLITWPPWRKLGQDDQGCLHTEGPSEIIYIPQTT